MGYIPKPDLKHAIAASVVTGLVGMWAYQVVETGSADTILYTYVVTVGFTAAAVLFGRGMLKAGVEAMRASQGEDGGDGQ